MAIPLPVAAKGAKVSAPKVKAAPPPKTSVTTGNNPRGTAIKVPKVSEKTLTTGASPRGTAILQPSRAPSPKAKPAPRKSSGGGGLLGAITNPIAGAVGGLASGAIHGVESIAPAVGHETGLLGKQIVDLVPSTIEGLEEGAPNAASAFGDLVSGRPFQAGSEMKNLVSTTVKGDPIIQSIEAGNLTPIAKNPLGTLMDAGMVVGGAGNALGAAGRAAGIDAMSMARDARPMVPGTDIPGQVALGGSRNAFMRIIQRGYDNAIQNLPVKARARLATHDLRQGIAMDHVMESGARHADEQLVMKVNKLKPKDKAVAAVAPHIVDYGTAGTGSEEEMLRQLQARYEREGGDQTFGATGKTGAEFKANIDKALSEPRDYSSVRPVSEQYAKTQRYLEEQQARLGMRDQAQMEDALRRRYMLQRDDVKVTPPVKDPRLHQVAREAGAQLKEAIANRRQIERDGERAIGQHAGYSKALASATRRLPLNYVNDRMLDNMLNERSIIDESAHNTRETYRDNLKAAKDAEKTAWRNARDAGRAWKSKANKIQGTMIRDDNAPAIEEGPLKGMRMRPVTEADYQEMLAHEHAPISYVSAKNPLRKAPQSLPRAVAGEAAPMAEVGRAGYTGESMNVGDVHPGWGALIRSQLNTVSAISRQRELGNFMDRYADPRPFTHYQEARAAADPLEAQTGVKLDTVQWNGALRNVPHEAVRELERQFKLDRPGKAAHILTTPNRVFRMTVLPYSPKLPVMHNVENTTRVAALEGGPLGLARAPLDWMRYRKTLASMTPEERAAHTALTTPGSLSRSGVAGEAEDLGRLPMEQQGIRKFAAQGSRYFNAVGSTIIRGQRILERTAQEVAMGAHERQMLQEFGHSWLDANTNVGRYADKLREGLATPEDAQRAASYVHKTMGQYSAFTANMRQVMRFMPFGSWYLNAARLVLVTLPVDHPMFSALLHDIYTANQSQWNQQHAGLPADLQTALNVGPSSWVDVGKLTPVGVPAQNPLATATQLTLPWLTGPTAALFGQGPFMQAFKGPGATVGSNPYAGGVVGGPQAQHTAELGALEQVLESFGGPLNDITRAIFGHGGTFYNTATPTLYGLTGGLAGNTAVKPGTATQQKGLLRLPGPLDKVFDPFHPTQYTPTGSAAVPASLPANSGGSIQW